jgi:hypothetical protein
MQDCWLQNPERTCSSFGRSSLVAAKVLPPKRLKGLFGRGAFFVLVVFILIKQRRRNDGEGMFVGAGSVRSEQLVSKRLPYLYFLECWRQALLLQV